MRFTFFLASLDRGHGRLKRRLADLRTQLIDPFFRQITLG